MPNPGLAYKIAELLSSSGPSSWPTAAAPANDVTIYAALRWLNDAIQGSAGVVTWPSAAAPANGVSMAEAIRDTWDALRNGTGGAEPETNKGIMDYLGVSPDYFNPTLGYHVTKTENVNTATGVDLFTLTNKVGISLWTMEVTNALDTTVTDYQITLTTLNGVILAAGNIASAAVGFIRSFNSDAGDTALSVSTGAVTVTGVGDTNGKNGLIVVGKASGTDVIKSIRTAGASGDAIRHDVWYWPLVASASLVAA